MTSGPSLTGKDIAEIARLLDASHFTALDLQLGEMKLRIRREGAREEEYPPQRVPAKAGTSGEDAPDPRLRGDSVKDQAAEAGAGEVDVIAPLLGNYYAAPRPGEDPFVQVGDRVGEDTVIAIIEVMKLMNSVRAGVSGTVTAVLVENGCAVEAGQALIRVRAD
ncbi:MAG: biotin/lipoyl-binding protein [Erythrobacter sp.]|nr:MAG: biotin/lipoyl-binding protein [Erythrobacter sp.]